MAVWHLYMIRCCDGALYTGVATDVERRLAEHQTGGPKAARYLRGKGPLELALRVRVGTRSNALKLEYAVKQLSKGRKEALVTGSVRTVRALRSGMRG